MAKTEEQLNRALAAFEAALREAVRDEAARSVDGVINRLSAGPFRVKAVEFDVVIHNLTLETESGRPSKRRPSPAAPSGPKRRGGRPPGALRSTLLQIFSETSEPFDVDALREALAQRGVQPTDDNLYQQLRRLVQAGECARAGRGRYQRAAAAV